MLRASGPLASNRVCLVGSAGRSPPAKSSFDLCWIRIGDTGHPTSDSATNVRDHTARRYLLVRLVRLQGQLTLLMYRESLRSCFFVLPGGSCLYLPMMRTLTSLLVASTTDSALFLHRRHMGGKFRPLACCKFGSGGSPCARVLTANDLTRGILVSVEPV